MSRLQVIAGGFIVGIFISELSVVPTLLSGCIAIFLLFVSALHPNPLIRIFMFAVISGIGVSAGHASSAVRWYPKTNCHRTFYGVVDNIPTTESGRTRFILRLQGLSSCFQSKDSRPPIHFESNAYITILSTDTPVPSVGDTIEFTAFCQVKRSHDSSWPISGAHKQFLTAVIPRANHIVTIATPNKIYRWLRAYRHRLIDFFSARLQPPNRALAVALTVGERSLLSFDQKKHFQNTGMAHLLAVSGLHLGIIALFSYGILNFIFRKIYYLAARIDVSRFSAALTIPIVLLFVFISGANPPVLRAAVMFVAMLLCKAAKLQTTPLQALFLAASLLLAHHPALIRNAGFQLSFGTVIVFLTLLPDLTARSEHGNTENSDEASPIQIFMLKQVGYWRVFFYNSALVAFVAAAATSPLLAFHFHSVPLLSPLTNFLFVPLVTFFVIPTVMLTALTSFICPPAAAAAAPICDYVLHLFNRAVTVADTYSVAVSTPDITTQCAVTIASISLLLFIKQKRKWAGFSAAACAGWVVVHAVLSSSAFTEGALTFDFLDMGQGDATLVTFPTGEHWLIDGGGTARQDIGSRHLVPILESLEVAHLDKVILTHPDPDHVMGLPSMLQHLTVDELWDNGQGLEEPTHPAYPELLRTAAMKKIPVKRGAAICGRHRVGDVDVDVLHPCFKNRSYAPEMSFNDNSIVLRFHFHRQTVLLTGDLSIEGEKHLLNSSANLSAQVLKLGHHGSAGASSIPFVQRVHPRDAIASCGFHNRFRFPSEDVRRRLKELDIQLHRTDKEGWIRYVVTRNCASFVK